jgi:hypothetical protein
MFILMCIKVVDFFNLAEFSSAIGQKALKPLGNSDLRFGMEALTFCLINSKFGTKIESCGRIGSCTLEKEEAGKVELDVGRLLEDEGDQLHVLFVHGLRHKIPEYGRGIAAL